MKALPIKIKQARQLRRTQTEAEYVLWNELKGRKFLEIKFRRQHPVGPYIADFICIEKHFIIEIDGGQHNEKKAKEYDEKRTRYLEEEGYSVLRFWNNEVLGNLEGVLALILTFSQREKEQDSQS